MGSLSSLFDDATPASNQTAPLSAKQTDDEHSDIDAIAKEEGVGNATPVFKAIYAQETGSGRNAKKSVDGAMGGMQIMPATFARYARPGERIDNPEDNLRVGARIVKDLAKKFNDDPAKIATAYFSGAGNVASQGARAWKRDFADGNGKSVSGYVSDVLSRLGKPSPAQNFTRNAANESDAPVSFENIPKWSQFLKSPRFAGLRPDQQFDFKSDYFKRYIAPLAPDAATAKKRYLQFMSEPISIEEPQRSWGEALTDTAKQAAEGAVDFIGTIPNLIDPSSKVSQFFNDEAQDWHDWQSDAEKWHEERADARIQSTAGDGVVDELVAAAAAYFKDPMTAAQFVSENLPSMVATLGAGGAAAKGAQAAMKLSHLSEASKAVIAARTGLAASGAMDAVSNAGDARQSAFADVKSTLMSQGMSEEDATDAALKDSRVVAAVGGVAGLISGMTGLQKSFLEMGAPKATSALSRALKSAGTELGTEELENVAPQIAQNAEVAQYDPERSLGKDVGRTIVETALGVAPGAALGGGIEALQPESSQENASQSAAPAAQPATPTAPPAAPVAPQQETPPLASNATASEATPVSEMLAPQASNDAAKQIVSELAQDANLPQEMVLPESQAFTDANVYGYAAKRLDTLMRKRDGDIKTSVDDKGRRVETRTPGQPLTEKEQREIQFLNKNGANIDTLRNFYGFPKGNKSASAPGVAPKKTNSAPDNGFEDWDEESQKSTATPEEIQTTAKEEEQPREENNEELAERLAQETSEGESENEGEGEEESAPSEESNDALAERISKQIEEPDAESEDSNPDVDRNSVAPDNDESQRPPQGNQNDREPSQSESLPAGDSANPQSREFDPMDEGNDKRDEGGEYRESLDAVQQSPGRETHTGGRISGRPSVSARRGDGSALGDAGGSALRRGGMGSDVRSLSGTASDSGTGERRGGTSGGRGGRGRGNSVAENAQVSHEVSRAARQSSARGELGGTESVSGRGEREGQTGGRTAQERVEDRFSGNKIFTADKVAAARARLKKKFSQLNIGIDPEALMDGMTIAGAYIESGVRDFSEYAHRMISDFGDAIKPYLLAFWEGARNYPGLDTGDMTDVAESKKAFDALSEKKETPKPSVPRNEASSEVKSVAQKKKPLSSPNSEPGQEPDSEFSLEPVVAKPSKKKTEARPASQEISGHVISDADEIGKGGLGVKYRDNVAAIRLLKPLEEENRTATPEERKTLARYVGWGALKSSFDPNNASHAAQYRELKELLTEEEFKAARHSVMNAHYTSPAVVRAMFGALQRLGFERGRILEPALGVGNFFGLMPLDMRRQSNLFGVEMDDLTSRLAAALYPEATIAKSTPFQKYSIPSGYFDAVIGNPPFGSEATVDDERSPYSGFSIHNYFLCKGIDKLRPGGLMAVVVSHYFLDSSHDAARKWIGARANLIGAVRLPDSAFKENAGTEVVTDILVFQKEAEGRRTNAQEWTGVKNIQLVNDKTGETSDHYLSNYFILHPENVLGKQSASGTMYRGGEYNVTAEGDTAQRLEHWVESLPEEIFNNIDRSSDQAITDMMVPDGVKVGGFYIDSSLKIMRRGEDRFGNKTAEPFEAKNKMAAKRLFGMIEIRDTLRKQMRLERSPDATVGEIEANRKLLNEQYDRFKEKHGFLNASSNKSVFNVDPESHLILGLEFDYDRGLGKVAAQKEGVPPREPSAVKADIFSRRVFFPSEEITNAATAEDALIASLNLKGGLDLAYMEDIYGKDRETIVKELGDRLFDDPRKGYVLSDEYLSGDVKTKLAEAEEAAAQDEKYRRNVEALKKVIPRDKKPSEISINIGTNCVPTKIYEEFFKHITGCQSVNFAYIAAVSKFAIEFSGGDKELMNFKFGTNRVKASELFELLLLGKGAQVRDSDGQGGYRVNQNETEAARDKQDAIREEWKKWIWADPVRMQTLVDLFNEKLNRVVERKFDGSHLTLPGASPAFHLLEHQRNGVWRGLQSRQVLYDHVVGAGKTMLMTSLAMEMRRLGIARKPLLAVPNHLTLQWRSDFLRLYPGANLLVAEPEDFAKDKRQILFSKMITGDWDAVIVGHSSLQKISLKKEDEEAILGEEIEELKAAIKAAKEGKGQRFSINQMEKTQAKFEAKLEQKMKSLGKRDQMVTFDELGLDALFVDELHEFKNLYYTSTMDRVPGMGNPAGSGKALDLFLKIRWLFKTYGDKAPIIGATGTPVSNSIVEMYNIQRFMQYPTLKAKGLQVFDAWATQFAEVEHLYEVSTSGVGYRPATRFQKFVNLSTLMQFYHSFADTLTLDDLIEQERRQGKKFPVPKVVGGKPTNLIAKRSPDVASFMGVPKAAIENGKVAFEFAPEKVSIRKNPDGRFDVIRPGQTEADYSANEEASAREWVVEKSLTPQILLDENSILWKFQHLSQLSRDSDGKVNALSLTGQAIKAGLDYRILNESAVDYPGSKINIAVDKMMELYHQWDKEKGTQLVFCDLSIPNSERKRQGETPKYALFRGEDGQLDMRKGTLHSNSVAKDLPYFLIPREKGGEKWVEIHDALSGIYIGKKPTKSEAQAYAKEILEDRERREKWLVKMEDAGFLEDDDLNDYIAGNDMDRESLQFFDRDEIHQMTAQNAGSHFSVYDDMRSKLIERGVPEREIAFIHDAPTPKAKEKLFARVNAGDVRFLFGSTAKMGAGTNVQKRIVGLHHIDAPWRPSDLEQRNGRAIRRGNDLYALDPDNFAVFIGYYATEQTYDTRRWQLLEHKARVIEQLRNYDGSQNEIEDISSDASNFADMKASASGDPLILEEVQLQSEITRLKRLQEAHRDNISFLVSKARDAKHFYTVSAPRIMGELESLVSSATPLPKAPEGEKAPFIPVKIGMTEYRDKEKAYVSLKDAFNSVRTHFENHKVLVFRGLKFYFGFGNEQGAVNVDSDAGRVCQYGVKDAFSSAGFLTRLNNYIEGLPAQIEKKKAEAEQAKIDEATYLSQSKQPFDQEAELTQGQERLKKVQRMLRAKGVEVPDEQKELLKAGIEAQKKKLRAAGFGKELDEFYRESEVSFRAFRDGEVPPGKFLPYSAFEKEIRRVARRFAAPVPVIVRDSVAEVLGDKTDAAVAGAVIDGQIFLFRDGIASPDELRETLFHELAHYGFERFMPREEFAASMARLLRRSPEVRRFVADWKALNVDPAIARMRSNGMSEEVIDAHGAGECLAALAENPNIFDEQPSIARRVFKGVAAWLAGVARRWGFTKAANRLEALSADDAKELVQRIFARMQSEPPSFADIPPREALFKLRTGAVNGILDRLFAKKQAGGFGLYDRTLSTQYNKALKDEDFRRVFDLMNAYQNEVSMASLRPAELAPGVLPRVDDTRSALKTAMGKGAVNAKDLEDLASAIFKGTLAGENVLDGKVWNDMELKLFGLSDSAVALYHQTRAAIDASIDETAAAESWAISQWVVPVSARTAILNAPERAKSILDAELKKIIDFHQAAAKRFQSQGQTELALDAMNTVVEGKKTKLKIKTIFEKSQALKDAGYAPLMRFGKYSVTARETDENGNPLLDDAGRPKTLYFGMFETRMEARAAKRKLLAKYGETPNVEVSSGTVSQEEHKLYAGVSPENIALFGEVVGADALAQKFYQLALSQRSALKRRLNRKGVSGFNENLPRVLANFLTSGGRYCAQRYFSMDINRSIQRIPQEKGDVKDEALKLKQYVLDPADAGSALSSLSFAYYLGGSVAAAAVNLSQPFLMTVPYLSQWGVLRASREMAAAMKTVVSRAPIANGELREALQRASREGIVDSQEIFHLYSLGAQRIAAGLTAALSKLPVAGKKIASRADMARLRVNAFMTLWGSMFSLAEKFNRKTTFIAAWNIANELGMKSPYGFSVRAVNETQGIYSKTNRPNWGRSQFGRTLLIFKQFSLMYMELLNRMWRHGGLQGKRAAVLMLAVMFLAAGEDGLPFAQDIDDLLDTLGQTMGWNTNMRRNKRKWAYSALGKAGGDLFLYGASSVMPFDLSNRLGLGNLIPATGILKPSNADDRTREAIELLGATAGMSQQLTRAYDAVFEGKPSAVVQNLLPKGLRDLYGAGEMAATGYALDSRGRKVTQAGLSDVLSKAMGFQPTEVANEYRKTLPIQQDIAIQKRAESSIADEWARGIADGDESEIRAAQARLSRWNRANPETPVVIKPSQLKTRAAAIQRERGDRITRQMPREMRGLDALEN